MEKRITDKEISAKLKRAFVFLRRVEDNLEILIDQAPDSNGFPIPEQARQSLREALSDLDFIARSLDE